jgi:hypothetical protein
MEASDYIGEFLAGLFFLIIGIRLLRLSLRTGESPERQLGIYFALSGLSYLAYVFPRMTGLDALNDAGSFASRSFYSIGMFPLLQFIRGVYRPRSSWAPWLSYSVMLLLIAGVGGSAVTGNWAGATSSFFWLYYSGYTLAILWMTSEGLLAYSSARKRLRIGLCDSSTTNRHLLWACFGVFQTLACLVALLWEMSFAASNEVSAVMELLLGGTEIASIGAVGLAFFAPAFFRKWIGRPTASASTAGSN